MYHINRIGSLLKLASFSFLFVVIALFSLPSVLHAQSGQWVSAYYAGWSQGWSNNGILPAQNIDYSAVTHIIHFSLVPQSNGTLDYSSNSITPENSAALVQAAHAAGRKVLICVGGWATDGGFAGATSTATNRATFVTNLITFITARGYDGVDIDWEPLSSSNGAQYTAFITTLRTALDAITPRPLLTCAIAWQPSILAQVQSKFDQINIMSYDLAGAWPGWVTWHNSGIYDGGFKFPSSGGLVPSADGMVNDFIASGISASKLGIGIDFYGYVWSGGSGTSTGGATEPRQTWSTAPSVQSNVPYYTIMQNYYQSQYVRWDAAAQAAYLSIDNTGSSSDKFISFDDETTCQKKVQYAKNKGIGGTIIWELGGGYLPGSFSNRDRLLQAVKQASGGTASAPAAPNLSAPSNAATGIAVNPTLTWNSSVGATSYRLQVSTSSSFSSLVVDNSGNTATSYAASGLSNSTTYYWRVNAANTGGTSAWSNTFSFTTTGTPVPSSDLWVSQDGLASPWVDMSWNASVSYSSTEHVYVGTNAIKVVQGTWGGLSTHNGVEGSGNDLNPSSYKSFDFVVYAAATGTSMSVLLENDLGTAFPRIDFGAVAANQWVSVSVPMSQLNPNNQVFHRVDIMEMSGTSKTYFIDQVRLIGVSGSTAPASPVLVSPTNAASAISTSPTLSWNAAAGASSYRVQLSTSSSFATMKVDKSGIASTSYAVSGLSSGIVYYWRVNATNNTGSSNWSGVYTFTTAPVAPSKPVLASPVNGATNLATTPTLSWNAATGATSYRLQVSMSSSFPSTIVDKSAITSTAYATSSLASSTKYYWRVNATNTGGTSAWSNVFSFTTSAGTPVAPAVPTLAAPSNGATGIATNPTLSWNSSTGATSYRVQVSAGSSFASTVADLGNLSSTSSNIPGMAAGTIYYWRVNATNTGGTSSWSNVFSFTTSAGTLVAPAVPTLAAPSNGATGIATNPTLSWNTSTGATAYRVQVSPSSSFATTIVDQSNLSTTTSSISGLSNTTTYFWRVNASNTAGASAWSAALSFTTMGASLSNSDLWISREGLATPWMNASWSATVNFSSTERAYAGASAIKVVQGAWGGLSTHSGNWGSSVNITPSSYRSLDFAIFAPSTGTTISVLLENDPGTSFPRINYGSVPANQWVVISIPMSQLNPNNQVFHRIDILEMSGTIKTYYVDEVRLSGAAGAEIRPGAVPEEGLSAGGVLPESYNLDQNFPNPFNPSTTIRFDLPSPEHVSLKLYNLIGEEVATLIDEVRSAGSHSVVWNAGGMPSGQYFYRITAGSFTQTRKVTLLK
ncbi:MAG TPA: glycosyl hydrolase family 18 protein [Bacteroidota bacterium]|nr:glycosyl hydrolase family 18 protein [Bacteroidota bacterium]